MYHRRAVNRERALLETAARNVLVKCDRGDASHALVSATKHILTIHYGTFERGKFNELWTAFYDLATCPEAAAAAGDGWDMAALEKLVNGRPVGSRPEAKTGGDMSEPYVGLYAQKLRQTIQSLSDNSLRLFVLLATYADERGVCFPGIAELARQTGWRAETVLAELDCLQALGLVVVVRRGERDPFTRQMQPNVYAVNPDVVLVREPLQGVSFSLLNVRFRNPSAKRNHNQHQEPTTVTNASKPVPGTNTTNQTAFEDGDGGAPNAASAVRPDEDEDETQEYSATGPASVANPAPATPTPPLTPPRPRRAPADLAAYAAPLHDAWLESYAERLRAGVGYAMTMPNARYYVSTYGTVRIQTALNVLAAQPPGSVERPAGFVVALLHKQAIDPERDGQGAPGPGGPAGDGNRYVSGPFGEWINR